MCIHTLNCCHSCASICSTGVLIKLLLVVGNSSVLGVCAILQACSQLELCIGRIDWSFTGKDEQLGY